MVTEFRARKAPDSQAPTRESDHTEPRFERTLEDADLVSREESAASILLDEAGQGLLTANTIAPLMAGGPHLHTPRVFEDWPAYPTEASQPTWALIPNATRLVGKILARTSAIFRLVVECGEMESKLEQASAERRREIAMRWLAGVGLD